VAVELKNKHVVISGGSRGIGFAIARDLAGTGARLSLLARDQAKLDAASSELGAKGFACDVTKEAQVVKTFAACIKSQGPVDILINNAGGVTSAPLHKISYSDWKESFDLNLNSAFLCIQQVLPEMISKGAGTIINIASTAALQGYPYVSSYCAAKHALLGFTRSMALELQARNIQVAAVCPGYTETEFLLSSIKNTAQKTGLSESEIREAYLKGTPNGKFTQPQEVSKVVLDLCSQSALQANGTILVVDGGKVQFTF